MTDWFLWTLVCLLGGGIFLSFIRMLIGRTGPDRAVALDSATIISANLLVLIAFLEGRAILVDVALVYAVLSFLGVLAIARYLDGGLR